MWYRLLVTLDFPPRLGGVARYYDALAKTFRDDGTVAVVAPFVPGAQDWDHGQSYPIERTTLVRDGWLRPRWFPIITVIMRRWIMHRPLEVHVGQVLPIGTAAWLLSFILPRFRYIVYTHGMDITIIRSKPWKRWLASHVLNRAYLVVTISQFTKGELQSYGLQDRRIIIVPPCPTLIQERSAVNDQILTQRYAFEASSFTVLTVARFVERKGIDDVIRAVADIHRHHAHAQLVIIGDGPLDAALTQLINTLGCASFVTIHRAVSDEALSWWYDHAKTFVLTPKELPNGDVEGFGYVYLEANQHGVPVIASRTGGVVDAVIDGVNGLLVEPGNVEEIANALERLLTDDALRRRLGEQGRVRVEKEFRWEERVQLLLKRLESKSSLE